MCFVRKLLDYVFTRHELRWLDDILPESDKKKKEDEKKRKEEEKVGTRTCCSFVYLLLCGRHFEFRPFCLCCYCYDLSFVDVSSLHDNQ